MDVREMDKALAALAELYDLRLEQFVRTATAISGDRETGRDAVNDAFVSAIRGRHRYRGDGSLEAWLWRIVITHALKARRRGQRDGRETPFAPAPNGEHDTHPELRATLALLPERQRLILFLRYYADLDYQQIADALGLQRGTVGAALHAAHLTLRRQLKELIEG